MSKTYRLILFGVLCMLFSNVVVRGEEKIFVESPLFDSLGEGERGAILMVHFGTTHDDTRVRTLDALNHAVGAAFPGIVLSEAYSSRIVCKRLRDRGIEKLSPMEAMDKLRAEGVTHLLIVPSQVVYGLEMKALEQEMEQRRGDFREIRLTTPLLFYEKDYRELTDRVLAPLAKDRDTAYLLVGHGTYDSSTAQYAMLDHFLMDRGLSQIIVGCIEGYPYYDQALRRLRATGLRRVCLMPLMMVAGEHAKHDISDEWAAALRHEGYEVTVDARGLGELPEVQEMVVERARFFAHNRRLLIGEKKKIYEKTGVKLSAEDE